MGSMERRALLQATLAWISAGHVLTGLALLSGRRGIRAGSAIYGAEFVPTEQFEAIIRPAAVYVLAMAYLQAQAAREPERHRAVIDGTLGLFGARLLQRTLFARQVQQTFGIAPARHWATTIYFALLTGLLLAARAQFEREAA
jgi:hypothetical protein